MKFAHIITQKAVTVFDTSNPSVSPTSFDASHPQYQLMVDAIRSGDESQIENMLSVERAIALISDGRVKIFEDNTITVDGETIHNSINSRIIGALSNGYDNIKYMLRFLENVSTNPSKDSATELYEFLEHCDLPLTADGHFLAYKMVREDYLDQYTGTMDNSVGKVVEMPREGVNSNRLQTCSSGLHFASLKYIHDGSYGVGTGRRLMVVKINPRDVVSIPNDYDFSKGRCCRYLVVGELEAPKLPTHFTSDYSDDFDDDDVLYDLDVDVDVDDIMTKVAGEITEDTVKEIHNLLDDKWSLSGISKATGVSTRQIARLRDNEVKAWAYLHPSNRVEKVKESKGSMDESTVREVFSFLTDGWTLRAIEQATGVSRRHVARLRDGEVEAWNHLRPKSL